MIALEAGTLLALAALLALLLEGFFIATQTAVTGIGTSGLERLEDSGIFGKRLRRTLRYRTAIDRQVRLAFIAALILAMLLAAMAAQTLLSTESWELALVASLAIYLFHLIFAEVVARRIALRDASGFLLRIGWLGITLSTPFRVLVSSRLYRDAPDECEEVGHPLSELHLRLLPILRDLDRVLEEDTFEMIDSVREFTELTAEDVMTPRSELEAYPIDVPAPALLAALKKTPYSRILIYDGRIDRIRGILLAKEVLLRNPANPMDLLRQPVFAAQDTRLPELLDQIRQARTHLAVIQDPYGGTSGIVTLHDLFENIVGQIQDADDREENWIVPQRDGSVLLDGRVELWQLNERFATGLDEEVARTVAGLAMHRYGSLPPRGARIELESGTLVVEELYKTQLRRLRFIPAQEEHELAEGER